ncbi:MAG: acyl-CoA dehydrogenase family protein, partial [Pseudomonadota bacterium]
MDLSYTPEEQAFQAEIRTFMRENVPAATADKVKHHKRLTKEDMEEWHAILNEAGYLAGHWPEEFGGKGWNAIQRAIFDEELTAAHGPRVV